MMTRFRLNHCQSSRHELTIVACLIHVLKIPSLLESEWNNDIEFFLEVRLNRAINGLTLKNELFEDIGDNANENSCSNTNDFWKTTLSA
ncbi:hypothetical protein AYI69_g4810 [Smittium culicis]|uniref:Uncharacterized protein n=1 Tax=Smittium culicis TaxID=133412 RepID=A0A1R1Y7V3_9FUNG|nr:hypothetical protein AYI69_g5132 [Smittium culicis]OMJ23955.1 hypothetical protein AYI69_g4810 [Smittium culicis]